jgi:hypothetical protein
MSAASSKAARLSKHAAETRLWEAPAPVVEPEIPAQPTLFGTLQPESTTIPDPDVPVQPDPGIVRAGTGVGRRSRTPNGKSGSSPMTAPRAPEASKALPSAALAAQDDLATPETVVRSRRGRPPSGPDAATRAAAAARRHRADLLSTAVLALALLATLVAFGAFDVSKAACEPTGAVPSVSCS